jgi:unsaturated rhamnogalacturonyl hydrolase
MMKLRALILATVLVVVPGTLGANPDAAEVLEAMERAADWQLAHPATNCTTFDWHNAAFYAGVMSLVPLSESDRFHDAMVKMGEGNEWKLGPRPYHADDHAVGQTYVDLFLLDGGEKRIAPMRETFDSILANPKDDNLDFDEEKNPDRTDRWSWCDALFMAPPAWLRLWKATGDARYLEFANTKWWVTSDFLYDDEEHLYARDSSLFPKRERNGRKIFWSRGNGWVMAGLVRVLQLLPADHPDRGRYVRQFEEMAATIITCQQEDGLWRSSLLDPASYPMKEVSGSSFHCYALTWGVNEGILDRRTYGDAALRAWNALTECLEPDGRLTHVQPVGYTPVTFDPQHTEAFGVGAFLLAGSEIHRLALSSQSRTE